MLIYTHQVNRTLTRLSLVGNEISTVGARNIAEAIRVNTTLTELWLGGHCEIDQEGQECLQQARADSRTLKKITL